MPIIETRRAVRSMELSSKSSWSWMLRPQSRLYSFLHSSLVHISVDLSDVPRLAVEYVLHVVKRRLNAFSGMVSKVRSYIKNLAKVCRDGLSTCTSRDDNGLGTTINFVI
jgi:hypothetical protein